jgi:trigger factor
VLDFEKSQFSSQNLIKQQTKRPLLNGLFLYVLIARNIMNVTQENINELNAKISIEITPADYLEKVKSVLETHRKKMNLPGFRVGKVPFGVAKKMYGKSVLAEELNKVLSQNLNNHIRDNKLNLLGQPLPQDMGELELDFDKTFVFNYDLGLAPEFEIALTNKEKFSKYKIVVDEELINKYVRDFQRRYGKSEEKEEVTEKDMIYGVFYELDKDGTRKQGGIHNHSTIVVEYVENAAAKKKLIGTKKGDVVVVEPSKLSKGEADLSAMLNVPAAQLDEIGDKFELKIDSVHSIDPHPLNQELFDRVVGPGAVSSEEEFRAKLTEDLGNYLNNDSERKLRRDINEFCLEKLKLELPNEFLKKWLLDSGAQNPEKPITAEDIEREYDEYSRYLKVQLIENKLATDNEVKVEPQEIQDHIKAQVRMQFASFGQGDVAEDMIDQFAQNYLQNQDEVRKVYDLLLEQKMMEFYKNTVKVQEKEVSFDEFAKLASNKPGKGKFMDQISNLLKF